MCAARHHNQDKQHENARERNAGGYAQRAEPRRAHSIGHAHAKHGAGDEEYERRWFFRILLSKREIQRVVEEKAHAPTGDPSENGSHARALGGLDGFARHGRPKLNSDDIDVNPTAQASRWSAGQKFADLIQIAAEPMCGKFRIPIEKRPYLGRVGDEADVAKQSEKAKDDFDASDDALRALTTPSLAPKATESAPDDDDGGMLDLRALTMSQAPAAPQKAEPVEKEDDGAVDLKAVAAPAVVAPTKSEPAKATPVAAKVESKKAAAVVAAAPAAPAVAAKSSTGLYIGIAVVVALGVGGYFAFKGGGSADGENTIASNEVAAPDVAPPAPTVPPPAPAAAEIPSPTAVENAAPPAPVDVPREHPEHRAEAAPSSANAAEPAAPTAAAHSGAAPAGAAHEPAAPATAVAAPAAAEPANPAARTGNAPVAAEMNSLLDEALGGAPAAGGTRTTPTTATAPAATAPAAPAGPLPTTPSQSDVQRTLGRLLPAIRQCAGDQVGLAMATILVRNDGNVASSSIAGAPFGGTPQGACMEGVVRTAHFPPFRQTTLRVTYPFSIRAAQ